MIRFIVLLCAFCSIQLCNAQPSFIRDTYQIPGGFAFDQFNAVLMQNILPGPPGNGVEWDFSDIKFQNNQQFMQFVVPGLTPFSSEDIDFLLESTDTSYMQYVYEMYKFTDSSLLLTGNALVSSQQGKNYDTFQIPARLMIFPWRFGQSYSDTNSFRISRRTYDGFGTLRLPFTTLTGVRRIREEFQDGEIRTVEHTWYMPGLATPILYLTTDYAGQSTTIFRQAMVLRWRRGQFTSIPSGDIFHGSGGPWKLNKRNYLFDFNDLAPLQYIIYDMLGNEVSRGLSTIYHQKHMIDFPDTLPHGLYPVIFPGKTGNSILLMD
jgi:hypothetical protein